MQFCGLFWIILGLEYVKIDRFKICLAVGCVLYLRKSKKGPSSTKIVTISQGMSLEPDRKYRKKQSFIEKLSVDDSA